VESEGPAGLPLFLARWHQWKLYARCCLCVCICTPGRAVLLSIPCLRRQAISVISPSPPPPIYRCANTGKAVPKDKAIKRMLVRSIVDQSSARDIKEARVFENYQLPKLYIKQYYSVEAAVHQRLVRSRSKEDRRKRDPPERKRPGAR
jgi:small subunit ribosomal protein S26e